MGWNRPSNGSDEEEKYPPDFKIAVGETAVMICVEAERLKTRNGLKDIFRVLVRGRGDEILTFWWKRSLPPPPMQTPILIKRESEMVYVAYYPEDDAEMKTLWETGEAPEDSTVKKTEKSNGAAKAILSRFKS